MSMRRTFIGLAVRFLIATALSLLVWWLFVTPFDRLPLSAPAVHVIVGVLNFSVALAGELLYPIRGMAVLFNDGDSWCDFCTSGETFRRQMRIAIPTYLVLLYLPAVVRPIARRNPRLCKRIIIGLFVYAVFTAAYFLVAGVGDRKDDIRIAAMWLVILSAAAAFAWSKIGPRWKLAAIAGVLLAGAWAFSDEVQPYFGSYLVLLTLGVGGTLWLTAAIANSIDRWRRRGIQV